jgi:hypothetical protein
MESKEIVYVLTNPAMPGLVKIGKPRQSDVEVRLNQLYTTVIPCPFDCVYAVEVKDCTKVESALHVAFDPYRFNHKREFFEIEPEQAVAVLKLLNLKDVTPEISKELNRNVSPAEMASGSKLQKKRPRMNFSEMGIPVGSVLIYEDGVTEATVKNHREIIYR